MSPWLSARLLCAQTDERLAALAAEGHERAFAVLVERYRRPLLAYVRGLGADGRAEDIVQQALLQAWNALRGGTHVTHVRGWLHQIARRATWRAVATPAAEELSPTLAAAADTEGEVERRLQTRWLLAELERLPERQRDALVQTALQGRSGAEVADGLGLTDNALRQLLFRARKTLRAAAGAIVPLPVVTWAIGRSSTSAPTSEQLAQLVGTSGSAGLAAALTKVAAVTAAAATVAGGVAVRQDFDGVRQTDRSRIVRHAVAGVRPATASGAGAGAGSAGTVGRDSGRRAGPNDRRRVPRAMPQIVSEDHRPGGRDDGPPSGSRADTPSGPASTQRKGASAGFAGGRQRSDQPTVAPDDAAGTTPSPQQTALTSDAGSTDPTHEPGASTDPAALEADAEQPGD